MAASERVICATSDLEDGGMGVKFQVRHLSRQLPAFAIRSGGVVTAFLNQCAHVPIELDWSPGIFFDADGQWLVCATHGALYDPTSGRCLGGRCQGRGLTPLSVSEGDGVVKLVDERYILVGEDAR